jgi:Ni2+-binding GTPase involved in maturation of urease and hydrogenase
LEELQAVFETELLFVESGGDNLAGELFFPAKGKMAEDRG